MPYDGFTPSKEKYDVSGVLWPYFVVACEAIDTESRLLLMRYLDRRQMQGVGNSGAARRVILAVWKEREECDGSGLTWVDVMARERIDVLLL